MSIWRKMNEIFFYIVLVLAIIAILVVSLLFVLKGNNWILGLLTLIAGAVLIPFFFSAWGILLEFLDNVADIRNKLCDGTISVKYSKNMVSKMTDAMRNNSRHVSSAPINLSAIREKWVCPDCNSDNAEAFLSCWNCGRKK